MTSRKRLQDPSARLGSRASAHWRKLEQQDRLHLAERARERPEQPRPPAQP